MASRPATGGMEYAEAVNSLRSLSHSRMKLGLERTTAFLEHLGNPHDGLACVQIAGSNGKGSAATLLASVLRAAGLSVGLYTSPHLSDVRERIRVDGRKVRKEVVRAFAERTRPYVAERSAAGDAPTFFEVSTVLALEHFAERGVDVAILEVGIGGRFDATSVVDPVASAVTSVSLEHTAVLGDTVEEIARDQATVAPADAPLVTAATDEALAAISAETDVLTVGGPGADVEVRAGGSAPPTTQSVVLDGPDWHVEAPLGLLGAYQRLNAGIAAALARQVADVDEAAIAEGIGRARWPGRFEVVDTDPLVVLDGAHNPDACSNLATALAGGEYDAVHLVFGAMREKAHDEMVANLPAFDSATLCRPGLDRAAYPDALATVVRAASDAEIDTAPSVSAAVERALHRAGPTDLVLVTGSLYTVAEARDRWTRANVPTRAAVEPAIRASFASRDVPGTRAAELGADATHRTIRTQVRRGQADRLTELMLSLGGVAGASALDEEAVRIDVVLHGSLATFERLFDRIAESDDLRHLVRQLRATLDASAPGSGGSPWGDSPAVMGILPVDGDGTNGDDSSRAVVERAARMAERGAPVVDVCAKGDRPRPVGAADLDALLPAVERLAAADLAADVCVWADSAAVVSAVLEAGADAVHDATGLEDPETMAAVAEVGVPVIVGRRREPSGEWADEATDAVDAADVVVDDAVEELLERVVRAERFGVERDRIVLDPSAVVDPAALGAPSLVDRLDAFRAIGCPVLTTPPVSSPGTGGDGTDDGAASDVATTALAVERGADVVRVADVSAHVAAVRTARSVTRPD